LGLSQGIIPCAPVPPMPTRPLPSVGSLGLGARKLLLGRLALALLALLRLGGAAFFLVAILFSLSKTALRFLGDLVKITGGD
jgi:hypothetical protein